METTLEQPTLGYVALEHGSKVNKYWEATWHFDRYRFMRVRLPMKGTTHTKEEAWEYAQQMEPPQWHPVAPAERPVAPAERPVIGGLL